MKIYNEVSLREFGGWSGGRETLEELYDDEKDSIESCLEELWNGRSVSETELNDFLWFERDTIAEWLGFSDWDSLVEYHEEGME